MSFNIFGPPSKNDIKVGYISTDRGYVDSVSVCEANEYAKKNPGTTFIFRNRKNIRYLNINEVNNLSSNDLISSVDSCTGVQLESECGPPKVFFYGGGGVGVQANPIIGEDGSILAVDLVNGGNGYQYPPIVEVKDGCGIGAGAVTRAVLGEAVEVYEVFDQESDFEEYELCETEDLFDYGKLYDPNGKDIGEWDPTLYANLSSDPIRREIRKYQDFLEKLSVPWWSTRKKSPLALTSASKVTRTKFDVTDKTYRETQDKKGNTGYVGLGQVWNEFMNKYAISPVPPSNVPGSDFAVDLFTFEWEEDFPYDGQYTFRGCADGAIKDLYLDNEKLTTLASYNESPAVVKKQIPAGVHRIRLDLKNGTIIEPGDPPPQQETSKYIDVEFSVYGQGGRTKDISFLFVSEDGADSFVIDGVKKNKETKKEVRKVRPNVNYKVVAKEDTKKYKFVEQGLIANGRKNKEGGVGSGTKIFADYIGSANDNDDIQVTTSQGKFTSSNKRRGKGGRSTYDLTFKVSGSGQQGTKSTINVGKSIFNTRDYISKADRKLWRTKPVNNAKDADFATEYGVLPFDPNSDAAKKQSYTGTHVIRWASVDFPADGNYTIETWVDDSLTLYIGNRSGGGKVAIGNGLTDVNEGGDEVIIRKNGFTPNAISTGKSSETRFFKAGKYRIRAELTQSNVGPLGTVNPMSVSINITLAGNVKKISSPKSWNDNPMGVALTIDAPLPPIPQEPIPQQEGRCPNNPIWSSRFPNAEQRWWPVNYPKERTFTETVVSQVPTPTQETQEVEFTISGEGRRTKNLSFTFSAVNGAHTFTLKGVDANSRTKSRTEKVNILKNVNYTVVSSANPSAKPSTPTSKPVFVNKNNGIYLDVTGYSGKVELDFRFVINDSEAQGGWAGYEFEVPGTPISFKRKLTPAGNPISNETANRTYTVEGGKLYGPVNFVKADAGSLAVLTDNGSTIAGLDRVSASNYNAKKVKNLSGIERDFDVFLTNFRATSSASSTQSNKSDSLEQGIIKDGKKNKEGGLGTSNRIFADYVDSANDNDDIQVSTPFGKFQSLNKRKAKNSNRSTYDLVYNLEGAPGVKNNTVTTTNTYTITNWTRFMNRYAISPVPPLNTPNSDGGGVIYRNSWQVDIPYDGFYKFGVQRDETARIYLDGRLAFDVKNAGDMIWKDFRNKVKFQKIFISKGRHTILIELENSKTETFTNIDKKVFSTKDWLTAPPKTEEQPAGSLIIKEGGNFYLLAGGNDLVELNFKFEWDDNISVAGIAASKIVINTETGPKVVLNRPRNSSRGSVSGKGTFRTNKKYLITIEGLNARGKKPEIVDTGPNPDQKQQRINLFDAGGSDVNAKLTAVNAKQLSAPRVVGSTSPSSKNGVNYSGPPLANYFYDFLSPQFRSPYTAPAEEIQGKTWTMTWSNVDFFEDGQYAITAKADDKVVIKIDGALVGEVGLAQGYKTLYFNTTKGKKTLQVELSNIRIPETSFQQNPVYFSLDITKNVSVGTGISKSWIQNPVAIAAVLIPPPCPKRIRGKGVITDVIVDDPGNGYPVPENDISPEITTTYPASLRLKNIIVGDPGINYNCGVDQIQITPSNGAVLDYECDTFGRIINVKILNPGLGFTRYPDIRMVTPSTDAQGNPVVPTGVNATFRPQFEVVRDPIVSDPAKLIQVTDLVGLKQTGYVDGRAYYGAVFYKDGVRYAGFYETPGDLVQVYTTLQESIDAQVTTPPSAIQRQGTDVTNNDPRLNIPNTPENLI